MINIRYLIIDDADFNINNNQFQEKEMGHNMQSRKIPDSDLPNVKMLKMEPIATGDAEAKVLPPNPSAGQGWCEQGLCYGSCGNGWFRLIKPDNQQLTCAESRQGGWGYDCGSTRYFTTC